MILDLSERHRQCAGRHCSLHQCERVFELMDHRIAKCESFFFCRLKDIWGAPVQGFKSLTKVKLAGKLVTGSRPNQLT